jgi:hypothetical protein
MASKGKFSCWKFERFQLVKHWGSSRQNLRRCWQLFARKKSRHKVSPSNLPVVQC